jgi:signal transduction histidine kinase
MTYLRASALRALPVGGAVFAVFVAALVIPQVLIGETAPMVTILLPFLAAAVCAVGVRAFLGPVDRTIKRITHHHAATPYSVLAETGGRIRSGELDTALPGLAKVLVDGTAARRAGIWIVSSDRLVGAAVYPVADTPLPDVANLAVLLARPDVDHVMPVVEGDVLRAVLTLDKFGAPVTAADRQLMRDVASGATLLLRGIALTAELRDRVRQAADLGAELNRSRSRLARARAVERRRLAAELAHAATGRLADVRAGLDDVRHDVLAQRSEEAVAGLAHVRVDLDEIIERFRSVARGVYPAVLRDHGPSAALEELIIDLPRRVDLAGSLSRRLAWEVESGIYYVAASALHCLAERPGPPIRVTFSHTDGRLSVEIVDPRPSMSTGDLQVALANDLERLAALGGSVHVGGDGAAILLAASLPERLEPLVEVAR